MLEADDIFTTIYARRIDKKSFTQQKQRNSANLYCKQKTLQNRLLKIHVYVCAFYQTLASFDRTSTAQKKPSSDALKTTDLKISRYSQENIYVGINFRAYNFSGRTTITYDLLIVFLLCVILLIFWPAFHWNFIFFFLLITNFFHSIFLFKLVSRRIYILGVIFSYAWVIVWYINFLFRICI